MKKKVISIGILILLIVIGGVVLLFFNDTYSTSLENIYFDGITIGTDYDDIDLSKYTPSDRYSGNYRFKSDEIVIGTSDDKVNYLFTEFSGTEVNVTVNGKKISTTDDLQQVLGKGFDDKSEDYNQDIRKYVYKDRKKNIKAEFAYTRTTSGNKLIWVVLSH